MRHTTNHPSTDSIPPSPHRRGTRWTGFAAALSFTFAFGAVAASPVGASSPKAAKGGCPATASPWELTTKDGWTTMSQKGLVTTFGTMDAAAAALGFADSDELIGAVISTFGLIDADSDDLICVSTTNPAGIPDFQFNVSDNKFNAKHLG